MLCQAATPSSSWSLLALNSFCSNLTKTTLTMHFVIICVQCELIKHVFFSQVWKVVMKMKDPAVSLTSFNQQGLLS